MTVLFTESSVTVKEGKSVMVCVAVSQGTVKSQPVVDIELTPGFMMGALPLLSSMYNELMHS